MTHFTYETLLNFLENQLSNDERSQLDAHLTACQACTQRLTRLQTVIQSAAEDQTVAPPQDVLKRAIGLGHARRTAPESKPWTRMVAALRFDSHRQFSSAAIRGTARGRQMLFSAERVDIDLQVKPGRTGSDLHGQVLSTQSSDETVKEAFVSLQASAGSRLRATETNSLGQFAFTHVASGTYDLVIDLGDQEVAITGLELQND